MDKKSPRLPVVNDIIGKTPFGELLLQSAPDIGHLQQRLSAYFVREFSSPRTLSETIAFQRVINRKAKDVPELNIYNFDADQRISELVVTVLIAATLNGINGMSVIPGWQKAGQKLTMKSFTDKESWDGLIYENPTDGSDVANPMFIEVKSTMVGPDEDVTTPNVLLKNRLEKYKKHFQSPGSMCAVFIMPYTVTGTRLSFDFKDATEILNDVVGEDAMGCVCLLSLPNNKDGKTVVTTHCYLVDKRPVTEVNGNIKNINLGKMTFGTLN
jgi:hypothetical protein